MSIDSTDLDVDGRIKLAAQHGLTSHGPAGLDLARVAGAAGVTVAELHDRFAHRDDMLTAMILDAYNAMGAEAEHGERQAAADGCGPLQRWVATCLAVRRWARANPEQYILIWGPPLPEYSAPPETMIAGARTAVCLVSILQQVHSRGGLVGTDPDPQFTPGMRTTVEVLGQGMLVGLPPDVIARMLVAWTQLLGSISFAVYGHVQGMANDPDAFFEYAATSMGRYVGLRD